MNLFIFFRDISRRVDKDMIHNKIFPGYAAGYYGYMREACFAANMFHRMFKNGNVLNPEVGMRYRKLLLEPGASKDGIELFAGFPWRGY